MTPEAAEMSVVKLGAATTSTSVSAALSSVATTCIW